MILISKTAKLTAFFGFLIRVVPTVILSITLPGEGLAQSVVTLELIQRAVTASCRKKLIFTTGMCSCKTWYKLICCESALRHLGSTFLLKMTHPQKYAYQHCHSFPHRCRPCSQDQHHTASGSEYSVHSYTRTGPGHTSDHSHAKETS